MTTGPVEPIEQTVPFPEEVSKEQGTPLWGDEPPPLFGDFGHNATYQTRDYCLIQPINVRFCAWYSMVPFGSWDLDRSFSSKTSSSQSVPAAWLDFESKSPSIDQQLAAMVRGNAAFAAPSTVKQFEQFEVTLTLANAPLDSVMNSVPVDKNVKVQPIPGVRMSSRMTAELIGTGFRIPSPLQEQGVSLKEKTVWTWLNVDAEDSGRQVLHVRINAIFSVNGKDVPRSIEVARGEISVNVNPVGWAERHWEWLAGSVGIPFVSWGALRILDRRIDSAGKPAGGKPNTPNPPSNLNGPTSSAQRRKKKRAPPKPKQ